MPDLPDESLVLDHVTVLDAARRDENAAVVVVGDTIWQVTEAGLDWPEDATILDLQGATVIPGLIDSHVHLAHAGTTWWVGDTLSDNLTATLSWGVVGVMDAGSPLALVSLRDRIARGEVRGPRTKALGPMITAALSHPCEHELDGQLCALVDGDGAEVASEILAAGADGLKIALQDADFSPWPSARLDLADLADVLSVGGPAWVHVGESADLRDAVAAGARGIAHVPFGDALPSADAELPFDAISSTVSLAAGPRRIVGGEDLAGDEFGAVPEPVLDAWAYTQQHPEILLDGWIEASAQWEQTMLENLGVLRAAEAPVVVGSDAGYYFVPHGVAAHWELEALVDAGFTPVEALAAATAVPADLHGWSDLGFVDAGYRADLVVVDGDPASDITATQAIRALVLGGVPTSPDEVRSAGAWVSAGEGPCLDDSDCPAGACDAVDHTCAAACPEPYQSANTCGADSWCMPADGLSTTEQGVCHVEQTCELYTECPWPEYPRTCVPADLDTAYCFPAGDRLSGETCSWTDPELRCAPGLLCSWVTSTCYELCDPDGEDACEEGSCKPAYAEGGAVWFGLCW